MKESMPEVSSIRYLIIGIRAPLVKYEHLFRYVGH